MPGRRSFGRRWTVSVVVGLTLAVGPGAGAGDAPHATDVAGDANAVNGQGQNALSAVPGSISTGPGSYAPADLRAVSFETLYEAIPVGEDGIDYRATGFAIRMRTEAAPTSDAGTLVYSVVGGLNGCNGRFKVFLRGPLSGSGDPADRSFRWGQTTGTCPDAMNSDTAIPGSTVTIDPALKELAVSIPLSALNEYQRPYFEPGSVLDGLTGGGYYTGPRAVVSSLVRGANDLLLPVIDDTPNMPPFVIGSDMPADVPCTVGCP
jgi:hypothetical protein